MNVSVNPTAQFSFTISFIPRYQPAADSSSFPTGIKRTDLTQNQLANYKQKYNKEKPFSCKLLTISVEKTWPSYAGLLGNARTIYNQKTNLCHLNCRHTKSPHIHLEKEFNQKEKSKPQLTNHVT